MDNIFSFKVALNITRSNAENIIKSDDDNEPRTVEKCQQKNDRPIWKETMQAKLNSHTKREVFGPVVQTPEGI